MFGSKANQLTRRSFLTATAAFSSFLMPFSAHGLANQRHKKVPFGVAVQLEPFRHDPFLKKFLIKYADVIVPMNALKWASLRYDQNKFDFSGADEIITFAEQHKRAIHGHTLLWYGFNPPWLDNISSPRVLEKTLVEHIETVVDRYKGRIKVWDVVNEVVAHDPLNQGMWRKGVWSNVLGPRHVDIAFKTAAATDPKAQLFINDYDLSDFSLRTEARQKAILKIVEQLQDQNIPIHGVGLQGHLYAERQTGREKLISFIQTLKAKGLTVAVTELDVIDWKLSADHARRDRGVAHTANDFLDAITTATTPHGITVWGLSDKYSWVNDTFPRKDSAIARPLPFDANWQAKPLFDVLKNYVNLR